MHISPSNQVKVKYESKQIHSLNLPVRKTQIFRYSYLISRIHKMLSDWKYHLLNHILICSLGDLYQTAAIFMLLQFQVMFYLYCKACTFNSSTLIFVILTFIQWKFLFVKVEPSICKVNSQSLNSYLYKVKLIIKVKFLFVKVTFQNEIPICKMNSQSEISICKNKFFFSFLKFPFRKCEFSKWNSYLQKRIRKTKFPFEKWICKVEIPFQNWKFALILERENCKFQSPNSPLLSSTKKKKNLSFFLMMSASNLESSVCFNSISYPKHP